MATRNVYMHSRKVYGTCLLLILILGMVASAGGAAATPSTCALPPAGMVAWYPGDDNSEDIAGDNDGTLQNGATFTTGKVAQAFSFDGIDDYVLVPDHPSLDSPTAVSVDVWMKATNGNGFQGLVSKFEHYTHPANDDAYNISIENGTIRWQIVAGPLLDFQLNTPVLPIFDGEWHLLAGTYDSTAQRMVLYVDGIEVASARAYGLISDVNTPLYLGAAKTYGANAHYFHGQLDEVEVFNRALTAAEVLSIYNAGSAGKCKNANPATSTETATAIPTSTSIPTYTETATAIATDTATNTPAATNTASHTATATGTATATPANTFGYVTGRGEMHHTQNNDIFAFRFNAKSDAEGIKANCSVADNGEGIHIRCLDATVFVQNGNHVTFAGNALINGAPVTYRIDVEDNGEPGKGRDIFTIQLGNGYTASGLLTQGNIQVHR